MINLQLVEKQDISADGSLDIQEVFATLQGEGPFAGCPAIFVRTAGCDLQCPACDTDYTSRRKRWAADALAIEVQLLWENTVRSGPYSRQPLAVLTGGEPLRQGCGHFVNKLLSAGFDVQVETNGTLFDPTLPYFHEHLTVVCSPKTGALSHQLKPYISALKYIIQADKIDPDDGLPTDSLNFGVRPARPWAGYQGEVYVQPCDEQDSTRNATNTKAAVDSCMRYGYRLCLQLHKIVNLP